MLDTNAFNRLLDENIDIGVSKEHQHFITNLQKAEIKNTRDAERRNSLLSIFRVVNSISNTDEIDQHSTPWGSPWDSPWDKGGQYFSSILKALEKRKPKDRGNQYDAVMIETCKYEDIVFVSNDRAVQDVSKEFGVECIPFQDYLAI